MNAGDPICVDHMGYTVDCSLLCLNPLQDPSKFRIDPERRFPQFVLDAVLATL